MRVLALVGAFGQGEADEWVEALSAIVARAHLVDDADAMETLQCVTQAAGDPSLPYELRQRLYTAAIEHNLPTIARLFLLASPQGELPRQRSKQLGPERPLRPSVSGRC